MLPPVKEKAIVHAHFPGYLSGTIDMRDFSVSSYLNVHSLFGMDWSDYLRIKFSSVLKSNRSVCGSRIYFESRSINRWA